MKALIFLVLTVLIGLPGAAVAGVVPPYRYVRAQDPPRTLVLDESGTTVATLTDGSRTAVFLGPPRTFAEPGATGATVTTRDRVRVAPRPWQLWGEHDVTLGRWLARELSDEDMDVLDIAMQYRRHTPDLFDAQGVRYAGRAYFGPDIEGERVSGSDFTDYLGVPWTYPGGLVRKPDPARKNSLDCSGFLRMVFGYRAGYPLGWDPAPGELPREVQDIAAGGPGTVIVANSGSRPPVKQLARLQTGDVLLFDLDPVDGPLLDHSALFLGVDSQGQPRFVSSRKRYNGPTMGDKNGASLLSGDGVLAQAFRLARRF